jgi:putative oxidoreductase
MTMEAFLETWAPRVRSIFRIILGLLFIEHGSAKLLHFPEVAMFDDMQLFSLLGLSAVLELLGGVLLFLGLFTRITAFILSGEMAFAYFMVHAPRGFFPLLSGGEPAVFYCFAFLYLAAAGGGAWSLDNAWRRRAAG